VDARDCDTKFKVKSRLSHHAREYLKNLEARKLHEAMLSGLV
jgi:hypothetical protein